MLVPLLTLIFIIILGPSRLAKVRALCGAHEGVEHGARVWASWQNRALAASGPRAHRCLSIVPSSSSPLLPRPCLVLAIPSRPSSSSPSFVSIAVATLDVSFYSCHCRLPSSSTSPMPPWMVLVIAVSFDFHIAGAVLKEWASEAQEQWLTEGDNFEKFSSGKLTMSERRVLMTFWIGFAWEKMKWAKHAEMRSRAFEALVACFLLLGPLLTTILPTDIAVATLGCSCYSCHCGCHRPHHCCCHLGCFLLVPLLTLISSPWLLPPWSFLASAIADPHLVTIAHSWDCSCYSCQC